VLLCAITVLFAGCGKQKAVPPDVVARVGDRNITLDDFKRYLEKNAGSDLGQIAPEAASALLDQYVEEALISEYAIAHGTDVPSDKIAAAVRNDPGSTVIEKRDEMRRLELLNQLAAKIPPVTDEQVKKFYEQYPQEFDLAERVHARQILVHDQDTANQVVTRLNTGTPFEQASAEYSKAPNAKMGGDLGFVARGQLPKVFEDELFAVKPGSISRVIQTDNSFHIFKIEEYQAAGPVPLHIAMPAIRVKLQQNALDEAMTQLLLEARKEINVAVLVKRLPFHYSGGYPQSSNE
jgi:Parvulin-like peptidyl-prolyl isomerase